MQCGQVWPDRGDCRRARNHGTRNGVDAEEIGICTEVRDFRNPFETKHGVKGAEFENVLVVVGRGWNQYNFGEMLELSALGAVPMAKAASFERNRNLFYVACSRPKRRLTLLFTQHLSAVALGTLAVWFGENAIEAATF